MKKTLSLIVSVLMVISCFSVSAIALEPAVNNDPDVFAMGVVAEFVSSNDPIVTWNNSTVISDRLELYSPMGDITGYIYHLETNGEESGYIQTAIIENGYTVVNLGFEGDDYVTSFLAQNELTYDDLGSNEIYYTGNFNYYVLDEEENIVDLANNCVLDASVDELEDAYLTYQTALSTQCETSAVSAGGEASALSTTAASTTTIYNYSAGFSAYKNANYYKTLYPGMKNHCTPTAGTNMVLYWSVARGHAALGTTAKNIFDDLYDAMDTTIPDGTLPDNVYGPMRDYFMAKDNHYTLVHEVDGSVTFSEIKYVIDNDIPVMLNIIDWSAEGGHSINVWGYNTGGTNDYYYVSTNISSDANETTPTYSLININTYNDFYHYVYAGYIE